MAYEKYLIHKRFPIIPILGRINPISRNGTYFFNTHSNIAPIYD